MSIRGRLVLLVLAVLVPAVLASVYGMAHLYRERERSVEHSLIEMSRAMALLVDREIARRDSLLSLLAVSPAAERGDLAQLEDAILGVARASGAQVFLQGLGGEILLASGAPEDAVIPPEAMMYADSHSSGTLISDTYQTPGGVHSYALRRPVIVDGKIGYYLSMISPIGQFQEVLIELKFPDGWTGVTVDRKGTIVARNRNPHRHVGRQVNPDVMGHLSRGNQGFFASTTRDNLPSLAAFNKAPESGWSFIVALPEDAISESATGALKALAIVAIILLVAAVVSAVRVGRSIVAPMRLLASQARTLGAGKPHASRHTGLRETDLVSAAMAEASVRISDTNLIMEQRVAEAVAEAERSQAVLLQSQKLEALGRITGGIAHDFNNLLQTLSTGLHIADLLTKHPDAQSALASCKRAVGRAAKLTRQLMVFGRSRASEAGRLDVCDQILAMEDLLKGALRSDISLRLDLADDLWPVHVDALQFELALLNLAINARDAVSGAGDVEIAAANVSVSEGEVPDLTEGDYVKLSFRDSGEGMTPEVLQKALDPFFTTKPSGKGSGLGLAQVYGFVKQSCGGVTLASVPGKGTRVTLYLPRSMAGVGSETVAESSGGGWVAHTHAKVLLVEDDVLVRDVITSALAAHGFEVRVAATADEALALLDDHPVDIVFSDIVMPGAMNGADLARAIRKARPGLPIILTTGYAEDADIPEGIPIIPKPYEISAVVTALQEALSVSSAQVVGV